MAFLLPAIATITSAFMGMDMPMSNAVSPAWPTQVPGTLRRPIRPSPPPAHPEGSEI